jgi:hypothetical protein
LNQRELFWNVALTVTQSHLFVGARRWSNQSKMGMLMDVLRLEGNIGYVPARYWACLPKSPAWSSLWLKNSDRRTNECVSHAVKVSVSKLTTRQFTLSVFIVWKLAGSFCKYYSVSWIACLFWSARHNQ